MKTDLTTTEPVKISPEALEVANTYMRTLSTSATAHELCLPVEEVQDYLDRREVKKYIDAMFLEQGYINRFTLQATLNKIIEKKLQEAEESDMFTKKDLVDLLVIAHKIRMDEIKSTTDSERAANIGKQVNIQNNNFGENYSNLLGKLIPVN